MPSLALSVCLTQPTLTTAPVAWSNTVWSTQQLLRCKALCWVVQKPKAYCFGKLQIAKSEPSIPSMCEQRMDSLSQAVSVVYVSLSTRRSLLRFAADVECAVSNSDVIIAVSSTLRFASDLARYRSFIRTIFAEFNAEAPFMRYGRARAHF